MQNSYRLGYKVRYLVGREYAMQERLYDSKPSGDGKSATAFVDIEDSDCFAISTLPLEEFAQPSLSELLSAETAGQRGITYSLDLSRQGQTSYSRANTSTIISTTKRPKVIEEKLNPPYQVTASRSSLQKIGPYSQPSAQTSPPNPPPMMASNGISSSRVTSTLRHTPPKSIPPNILGVSTSQRDAGPGRISDCPVAMARSHTTPVLNPTGTRTHKRSRPSHAIPNLPPAQTTDNASGDPSNFISFDPIIFAAQTYEIVLIMDTREIKDQQIISRYNWRRGASK